MRTFIVLSHAKNLGVNVVCVDQLGGLIRVQVFMIVGNSILLLLVEEMNLRKVSSEICLREVLPPGFGRIRGSDSFAGGRTPRTIYCVQEQDYNEMSKCNDCPEWAINGMLRCSLEIGRACKREI
jgi:hypothetical protein